MKIIFHADDFGINTAQSSLILGCSEGCGGTGPLNSTSILVGSPFARECAKLARPSLQSGALKMGLHLNLVEGPSTCDPKDIPLLVDARGCFRRSFAQIMTASRGSGGEELRAQIAKEVEAQLAAYLDLFADQRDRLRVDSHQHTHLIPAVLDALLGAIEKFGCTLEYMRIPAEPIGPYASQVWNIPHYPAINGVKNMLLNYLWKRDGEIIQRHTSLSRKDFHRRYSALFFGLVLSGRMEHMADRRMLDAAASAARKRDMDVELLFHPGGVPSAKDCLDPELSDFVSFYLSEHRIKEREALRSITAFGYQAL